ncbi:unnamed protein product [Dovyalis caffra]|uniref:GST N-terminal domain-containing protein n=1 Tax=Dovyalis caffra TaxID=77055 RepID=A0AAV1RZ34_9ROSI|nr:unnamed protein product [Dovyalis caffra]
MAAASAISCLDKSVPEKLPPTLDASAEQPSLFDGTTRPAWYAEKVYPQNKVPSLEHNGKIIGESLDLIKYLESNFEGPSLLPEDLAEREFAEGLLSYTDEFIQIVCSSFKGDPVKEAAYIPFVERFGFFLSEEFKYDITAGRPKFAAWIEEVNKIEAYKQTKTDLDFLMEYYKKRFMDQQNRDNRIRGRFRSASIDSKLCFLGTAPPPRKILKAGDNLRQTRIFTNEDVIEYSKVSHDSNPLHFESEFARNAGFEDRLVHGMLVAALFPRIIASHFPGAVYVSQSLHFKSPVFIGDGVVGEVQAANIRENKSRYIVKFLTKCFKNDKLLVIDGEAVAILPTLAVEKVNFVG